MEAFIFVNTEAGLLWRVAEEALKIEGVSMAKAVTGQFDVILYVEFEKLDSLGVMVEQIRSLEGVERSQTSIVMPQSSYTLSSKKS